MAMINTAGNSSTISALRMKWILFFQIVSKNPRVSAHIIWFNLYLSLHLKILSDLVIHTPPPPGAWLSSPIGCIKACTFLKECKISRT